ncbi:hypothetical protein [Streptomyces sp. NBC_00859]|uniref:hypothetical protein n=1 Tax=Streptomyces sp. NBC_00859 TaxID=2903682 RepID=UPI00386ED4B5|nr:hypothetical protein OG584_18255 [Streptomyces sp. NBC_00859]
MSSAVCARTESGEQLGAGGLLELHTVPLDPKVVAQLAEVRVPTPQSVLIGWVDAPSGDPRGATSHALYLTPGGYAYRVTTYSGGRRANGADLG